MIPLRPKGDFGQLSDIEKDALTWLVLTGRNKLEVYIEIARPELKKNPNAKKWAEQFYAVADVRNYVKAYKETLDDFFEKRKRKKERSHTSSEDREKMADEAMNTFKDNVIEALNVPTNDAEILKDHAQLAKISGLLKEEEMTQAAPTRYLPERCEACRYKQFIDEQVELGNIEEDYD